MGFIASDKLSHDAFYRVDRYDVSRVISADIPLKDQLRFCERNAGSIHTLGMSATLNRRLPFALRVWFARRLIRLRRNAQLRHKVRVEDILHTNASGDFLLMSREMWFSLKGYPESGIFSHIDSYLCCMAASAGVHQIILPSEMRVYHQEHLRDSSSSRPMTTYEAWTQECAQMLRAQRPLIKNDANLGLGDKTMPEVGRNTYCEGW